MLLAFSTTAAYHLRVAETFSETPAPAGWLERLARSKAQNVAGQLGSLPPVLDRLRASAERLEARQDVAEAGVGATADL